MQDQFKDPWTGQYSRHAVDRLCQSAFLTGVLIGLVSMALIFVVAHSVVGS